MTTIKVAAPRYSTLLKTAHPTQVQDEERIDPRNGYFQLVVQISGRSAKKVCDKFFISFIVGGCICQWLNSRNPVLAASPSLGHNGHLRLKGALSIRPLSWIASAFSLPGSQDALLR